MENNIKKLQDRWSPTPLWMSEDVPRRPMVRPWAFVIVALVALVTLATFLPFENLIVRLFGPPRVELSEAYADNAAGPSFDHAAFDSLLGRYVDAEGWVDYIGLKANVAELDAYLESIAAAPLDEMGRDEKLALLINAYNASTLKLILDHYPIRSIQQIAEETRWDAVRWNIGGNVWSLNQIEHEQIRPKFIEPRVHFALVCAASSCPPLRNEAFTAARLERQLHEQSQYVHDHATWFRFDRETSTASLTKLYSWYGGDFTQVAGSPLEFASRYAPSLEQTLAAGVTPQIEWLPYEWELNSLSNKRPR
ncbi:hypothetical protein Pla52o_27590 [Novipirellula galeiformis]|uniref:DUF547 domain-containing protein n=2 Tax=Novipirellula galeiformis TaxID=2528004 RepID=A0A5C6CEA2_9BACT|nr:hypothetical protein Pla52o_27590 [Novipirellula galeiformis]